LKLGVDIKPEVREPDIRDMTEPRSSSWLTALRRRWMLFAAGIVIGAGLGALAVAVVGEHYEASVVMNVVSAKGSTDVDDSLGHIVGQLATRSNVVGEQLERAGFADVAEEPENAIGVEAAPDAPSFEITANADTADEAAEIANATAGAVQRYTEGRSERTGIRAAILSAATPPASSSSLSLQLGVLAGASLGLSISILIALARRPPE
jgi:capsular polysaccharide biosynthesis protein